MDRWWLFRIRIVCTSAQPDVLHDDCTDDDDPDRQNIHPKLPSGSRSGRFDWIGYTDREEAALDEGAREQAADMGPMDN